MERLQALSQAQLHLPCRHVVLYTWIPPDQTWFIRPNTNVIIRQNDAQLCNYPHTSIGNISQKVGTAEATVRPWSENL